MVKRLIVCADGTWNTLDQRWPTNVVKMARAITPTGRDGISQVVFYDPGVGTGPGLDRWTGGAFGEGLDKNIADDYTFLMHNYDAGDQIFLFGFSRGAYTVRSLGGLIRKCGLLPKAHADRLPEALAMYRKRDLSADTQEAQEFRRLYSRETDIWFVGVWDTVGALGIPLTGLRWLTRRDHQFHDVELSKIVKHAYHALAIDERRGPFKPTLWSNKPKPGQTVEQVWFSGVHTDVGGGNDDSSLSDAAFTWMKSKAEACGLTFDEAYVDQVIHPAPLGPLHNSMVGLYRLTKGYVRPMGQSGGEDEAVCETAVARYEHEELHYQPPNLTDYLGEPGHVVTPMEDKTKKAPAP